MMKILDAKKFRDASTASFKDASPFPHFVIDGAVREEMLAQLISSVAKVPFGMRSSDYIFAKNKYESPSFDQDDQMLADLKSDLLSPSFADFLSKLTGQELFVDPLFVGGGLHRGGRGSFLDMHADFSRHPVESSWLRELNILLYLNQDYEDSFGGHLQLRNRNTGEEHAIAPANNRMVVMLTKEHTLHGYYPISFPPGSYRTSIATYAYSIDHDYARNPPRTTVWAPDQCGPVKRLIATISPPIIALKNRLVGSSTARRAKHK